MRLDNFLVKSGICARRKAKELIASGLVLVNGKIVLNPAELIKDTDQVRAAGRIAKPVQKHVYIIFNKPKGVITSSSEKGRMTVLDLVNTKERIFNVGRLDKDTSGLLFLTNDGELANFLMHPSSGITKHYKVWVKGYVDQRKLDKLRVSHYVPYIGRVAASTVKLLHRTRQESSLEIAICEGKNRQIRRMLYNIGYSVRKLVRVGYASLKLGRLPVGEYRYLTDAEVDGLKKFINSRSK